MAGSGKQLVGFKISDGGDSFGNSPNRRAGLDSMLNAIENGETDGIQAIASLKDLGGDSKVFNTRDSR
jgi:hypothetical protein